MIPSQTQFLTHEVHTLRKPAMTLCPIALAVGCTKCPLVKICPVKEIIGDYEKDGAGDP